MNRTSARSSRLLALALATLGSGCAHDPVTGSNLRSGEEVVFLALSEPASAVMEALFQGSIVVDDAGCLRLGANDGHTVVWPHGFGLTRRGPALTITDGTGQEIGTVGGDFKFGGGEVQTLHEGIVLAAADRNRALTDCPGRYWIVGDTKR